MTLMAPGQLVTSTPLSIAFGNAQEKQTPYFTVETKNTLKTRAEVKVMGEIVNFVPFHSR